MAEVIDKETRIEQINSKIRALQEQLKGDLSQVHEPILLQIIDLLNERGRIVNG